MAAQKEQGEQALLAVWGGSSGKGGGLRTYAVKGGKLGVAEDNIDGVKMGGVESLDGLGIARRADAAEGDGGEGADAG
jgi:hypothetical protein